jgi:hypothetical protein
LDCFSDVLELLEYLIPSFLERGADPLRRLPVTLSALFALDFELLEVVLDSSALFWLVMLLLNLRNLFPSSPMREIP